MYATTVLLIRAIGILRYCETHINLLTLKIISFVKIKILESPVLLKRAGGFISFYQRICFVKERTYLISIFTIVENPFLPLSLAM